jgi:hypothetical protein
MIVVEMCLRRAWLAPELYVLNQRVVRQNMTLHTAVKSILGCAHRELDIVSGAECGALWNVTALHVRHFNPSPSPAAIAAFTSSSRVMTPITLFYLPKLAFIVAQNVQIVLKWNQNEL